MLPSLSHCSAPLALICWDTQWSRENLALRQQLAVFRRTVKRPRLCNGDRLFWASLGEPTYFPLPERSA